MKYYILKPSYYFMWLLIILFTGAIFSIAITTLPIAIKIILQLFCLANLINSIKHDALRSKVSSIIELQHHQEKEWVLRNKNGDAFLAVIVANSVVTRFILVLNFKLTTGKKVSVMVLPDALKKEELRQLRILLMFS